MTDHEALVRAVAAAPDDDHPRLVLADWLEEEGDAAQAEFLRTQVQLAHVPPWDPLAVRVKHRQPHLLTGAPWKHTLPRFGNGIAAEWNPEGAFRRGMGYSIHVRQLSTFLDMAPSLLEVCPVQELILPGGTRDDWHALMNASWFGQIRSLRFTFASGLIEPIRALAASSTVGKLERVAFDVCTSPAMGVITEALVQSPVAKTLKALSFSVGSDTEGEIAAELANVELPNLEELAFKTMALGESTWETLKVLEHKTEVRKLTIENQQLIDSAEAAFYSLVESLKLEDLVLSDCTCSRTEYDIESSEYYLSESAIKCDAFRNVKSIMMRNCKAGHWPLSDRERMRQIQLPGCELVVDDIRTLYMKLKWYSIVELDLSSVKVQFDQMPQFPDIRFPDSLEALVLSADQLAHGDAARLQARLGERLVLR